MRGFLLEKEMKELLIVKVGTSNLVDERGALDDASFGNISEQIIQQRDHGRDVVIVSSGAISAGANQMQMSRHEIASDLDKLSALAAVGQTTIMTKWSDHLSPVKTAQNLITPNELSHKDEGSAYIRKLKVTIELGAVAIINENDAVADEEIKVGDNDRLSALIATKLQKLGVWQVKLVMLSDIDGLFTCAPHKTEAKLIRIVDGLSEVAIYVDDSVSTHGTGGLKTKLMSADIASNGGVSMYLGNGREQDVIEKLIQQQTGTSFLAKNMCHLVE